MKKKKEITISINENETKSETIYKNLVNNMNNLSLNKDEQIEYLKSRITELETKERKFIHITLIGLLLFIILILGVFLVIQNFYTLGVISIISTFIATIYITFKLSNNKIEKIDKFEEIETIRKIISSKLK
ncbi:MAG: hypothetical protein J6D28_04725 [Bacilli bacterium]|nr:hypothetical protein [Bacilli bacterium]